MSTLTVRIGAESVELPLDQQLFIGLGLVSSGLIEMPQWWQRTSGQKLAGDDIGKAWLWREAVFAALSHRKATAPGDISAATKARVSS